MIDFDKKSSTFNVDLPKDLQCREQSLFSAPRQRLNVVEGREVIVNKQKLFHSVISELSLK